MLIDLSLDVTFWDWPRYGILKQTKEGIWVVKTEDGKELPVVEDKPQVNYAVDMRVEFTYMEATSNDPELRIPPRAIGLTHPRS